MSKTLSDVEGVAEERVKADLILKRHLGCVWYAVQGGTGQGGTHMSYVRRVPKWNTLELDGTRVGHACAHHTPWN